MTSPGRPKGATHIETMRRREKVFDLCIMGLTPTEMARHLNVSLRTIHRYLEDVKASLQKNDEVHRLRTLARVDAEYASLWRECELLLHSPILNDNPILKLRIIDALRQIADSRNSMIFAIGKRKASEPPPNPAPTVEETLPLTINLLPPEMREKAVETIRKRVELEKSS